MYGQDVLTFNRLTSIRVTWLSLSFSVSVSPDSQYLDLSLEPLETHNYWNY